MRERVERVERVERGGVPSSQPQENLSVAELRQLISLMNGSEVSEIALEHEASGLKLVLRKPEPMQGVFYDDEDGEGADMEPHAEQQHHEHGERTSEVRSPLVGVFRTALKPRGKPLTAVGDVVREGQVVAAVESLNVVNEVESPFPGRVKEVLVMDGQAVEYNQVLLLIEPLAGA